MRHKAAILEGMAGDTCQILFYKYYFTKHTHLSYKYFTTRHVFIRYTIIHHRMSFTTISICEGFLPAEPRFDITFYEYRVRY